MLSVILVNFAIELAVNLILSPAIYTVDRVVEKQIYKKIKRSAPANAESADADKEV